MNKDRINKVAALIVLMIIGLAFFSQPISAGLQTTGQTSHGRYQLFIGPSPLASDRANTIYRIDTETGKTWRLEKSSINERWALVSEP